MSEYLAEVTVMPRAGLLDPEGEAVGHALASLGFEEVSEVHVGKRIRIRIEAGSPQAARERVTTMCARLLANPVTEDYDVQIHEGATA